MQPTLEFQGGESHEVIVLEQRHYHAALESHVQNANIISTRKRYL